MDEWHLAALLFGLLIGLVLGSLIQAYKWASNAEDYRRVEYRGRLYKVTYADKEGTSYE